MLDKFEIWVKKTYSPTEAQWKRPVLFFLSLAIILACIISGYLQITDRWTNDRIWIVIIIFSFFSLLGLSVSIFSKDFWVALVLGGI